MSYRTDQPAAGRLQITGTALVLHYALIASWVLLVVGGLTILIKLAETTVGLVLLFKSRRLVSRASGPLQKSSE